MFQKNYCDEINRLSSYTFHHMIQKRTAVMKSSLVLYASAYFPENNCSDDIISHHFVLSYFPETKKKLRRRSISGTTHALNSYSSSEGLVASLQSRDDEQVEEEEDDQCEVDVVELGKHDFSKPASRLCIEGVMFSGITPPAPKNGFVCK